MNLRFVFGVLILSLGPRSGGSGTVVAKKKVYFTDSVRFNGQDPVSRSGKATGRGAFEVQSAQAISAAYYFDLAARDYSLADGAIELLIEGVHARLLSSRRKAASLSSESGRIGCEGENMLPMVANSVAICKNRAGTR